jgi:hypothetical protein
VVSLTATPARFCCSTWSGGRPTKRHVSLYSVGVASAAPFLFLTLVSAVVQAEGGIKGAGSASLLGGV